MLENQRRSQANSLAADLESEHPPRLGFNRRAQERERAPACVLLSSSSETHNQSIAQPKFHVVAVQECLRLLDGFVVIPSFNYASRLINMAIRVQDIQTISIHDLIFPQMRRT
jgi:hypothetical protein